MQSAQKLSAGMTGGGGGEVIASIGTVPKIPIKHTSLSDVIPDLVGDPSKPVRGEVLDEIHSASIDLEGQNGQTSSNPCAHGCLG